MKEYYTTGEVARICSIAPRTVQKYCEQGLLEMKKSPVTGYRRILRDSLLGFMRKYNIPVTSLESRETKSVFVVDDDKKLVKMITGFLSEKLKGSEIRSATEGYAALIEISATLPHLVILDLKMPKTDGFEVCRQLKNNPLTQGIKIIAITGHSDQEQVYNILKMGADRCLLKPFKMADLLAEVEGLLETT